MTVYTLPGRGTQSYKIVQADQVHDTTPTLGRGVSRTTVRTKGEGPGCEDQSEDRVRMSEDQVRARVRDE